MWAKPGTYHFIVQAQGKQKTFLPRCCKLERSVQNSQTLARKDWTLPECVQRLDPARVCPKTEPCQSVSKDWTLTECVQRLDPARVCPKTEPYHSVSKDWTLPECVQRLNPTTVCPKTEPYQSVSKDSTLPECVPLWYSTLRVSSLPCSQILD
jgi:hypothetical protein